MTKKQIIINAAIIIFVPTIITAGYYGYKAIKHYRDKKKEGAESDKTEKEKLSNLVGAKIIPISKQIEEKEKLLKKVS